MKTLITPESIPGSGSCVQLRCAGNLFIQSFDAYGYQRELSLTEKDGGFELHTYQHPGRRNIWQLTRAQGRKLMALLIGRAELHPALLFNARVEDRPKNEGFVRMQEAIFRGILFSDLMKLI